MTQKSHFFYILLLCLCFGSNAWGWGAPTHTGMASNVLNQSKFDFYISHFGLNRSTIASNAGSEPPDFYHHPGWERLKQRLNYTADPYLNWPVNNTFLGYLAHIACDSGVPVGHSPANQVYTDTVREALFEAAVSTYTTPAFPGSYTGEYNDVMNYFEAVTVDLATRFKNASYWTFEPYATEGRRNGMQLFDYVLMEYFNYNYMQVAVQSPNGGESLIAGSTQTITWHSQGEFQNISIQYSTNNGTNWIPIDTVANTGSYEWTVPTLHSTQCLIRLSDTEYSNKNDVSDGVFTIYPCPLVADMDSDCCVDINDLVLLADSWLQCNDPDNLDCR